MILRVILAVLASLLLFNGQNKGATLRDSAICKKLHLRKWRSLVSIFPSLSLEAKLTDSKSELFMHVY